MSRTGADGRSDGTASGRAWVRMAPWLLGAWAVAALLPGPSGIQLVLSAGASVFVVAAAARTPDRYGDRGLLALVVERGFTHLANVLTVVVLTAFAAAIGGTLGGMAAEALGVGDGRILSAPLAALAALPILWWHWPALVLAYVVAERAGLRRPDTGAWRGPRYRHARALVRRAGRPGRTALIVGFLYLWVVFVITTAGYRGDPAPDLFRLAVAYLVFFPLVVWMAITETRRMLGVVGSP